MNPRTRMVIFVSLILGLAPALLVHSAGQPGAKPANPINILTQKLKDSPEHVGKVMGERFADYIIYGADSSSPYGIKDGMKVQINSISVAWVAEKVKQNKAADVAQLYLVMGAGDQELTWLSQEPDLAATLKDKRTRRAADLSKKMKPWAMPLDARGVGQYSQGDLALWVRRFLGTDEKDDSYMSSAAQVSFSILKDSNIQKELGKSVPKNQGQDEGGAVSTGGAGTGGQPMTGSAKGFDYNSLFRGGAVIKDVTYQSGQSGQISIKMYTVKENGVLVNKVGIFDITNQSDTFGQKFSIPAGAGESTFALDDRKGGMSQYTLKFVPSGSETLIYFSREGSSDPKPTSVSELLTKRADQAIAAGDITDVGGKPYYVLGQGGAKGSLLFFSEDLPKRLAAGGSLTPEMAAEVCQRGSDGNNVILKHDKGPDLGKAADGKPYHLVFNREYGYWEVMSGEGDPEPQPAPPAPAGGTTPANPTGAETSKGGQGGCTVDTAKTLLEQQPNNAMAASPSTCPFSSRNAGQW